MKRIVDVFLYLIWMMFLDLKDMISWNLVIKVQVFVVVFALFVEFEFVERIVDMCFLKP